ncbi:hypothetical protein KCH_02210 [Kitasatospora cheerisanensis KCTC 2395]|uniref:Uncharacterized protein n=1 Tax=Kitasatospora cheerisanensis KCTC 2395 TaxID=1348663 RepID=A0A066Z399_9ACTN|nr:hypothetical protein KCH_02210 [Kitasatospora cheerisanensis KCTC 2395]
MGRTSVARRRRADGRSDRARVEPPPERQTSPSLPAWWRSVHGIAPRPHLRFAGCGKCAHGAEHRGRNGTVPRGPSGTRCQGGEGRRAVRCAEPGGR